MLKLPPTGTGFRAGEGTGLCFRKSPLVTVWRVARREHHWRRRPGGGGVGAWGYGSGEGDTHGRCLDGRHPLWRTRG